MCFVAKGGQTVRLMAIAVSLTAAEQIFSASGALPSARGTPTTHCSLFRDFPREQLHGGDVLSGTAPVTSLYLGTEVSIGRTSQRLWPTRWRSEPEILPRRCPDSGLGNDVVDS